MLTFSVPDDGARSIKGTQSQGVKKKFWPLGFGVPIIDQAPSSGDGTSGTEKINM